MPLEPKREWNRKQRFGVYSLDGRWPMLATTTTALRDAGLLGRVWESISNPGQPPLPIHELPVSQALDPGDLGYALGRRWRHEAPGFWRRLSPLRNSPEASAAASTEELKHGAASDLLDHPEHSEQESIS